MATATPRQIVLRFTWDDAFEDVYTSRRRDVVVAERVHRRRADRLNRRHLVIASLLVALTLLAAAGAVVSVRIDAGSLSAIGIDRREIVLGVAAMSALAALLAIVQALGRYARNAEKHRTAAIRYGSLDREMRATLASPRPARPQPDLALNDVRERIDRYAKESPAVSRRLRRSVATEIDGGTSAPAARHP